MFLFNFPFRHKYLKDVKEGNRPCLAVVTVTEIFPSGEYNLSETEDRKRRYMSV